MADPALVMGLAETLILTTGDENPRYTVELLGAVDAMRQREGRPREPVINADLGPRLEQLRQAVPAAQWDHCYRNGSQRTVEDLLVNSQIDADNQDPLRHP
ncbi:MAG: hypothetical protein ABI586_07585 [Candidatus Nanopelagicales bacterium]